MVPSNTSLATVTIDTPPDFETAPTGPVCVGNCPNGRFGALPVPVGRFTRYSDATLAGFPSSTFGFGDTLLTGSAIEPGGANASTRATASVDTVPNRTSGNANVGTVTSFVFALGSEDSMTVAFDADAFTVAQVPEPPDGPAGIAAARLGWSINIIDLETGDSVLDYTPSEINGLTNVSRTFADPGQTIYEFAGALGATSDLLLAGRTYQLTIQHSAFADSQEEAVPEPATLAIVAVGLLSMSLVSRRRKS